MPLSIDFAGKLVLITGGGRGIGLAITEAIAEGQFEPILYLTRRLDLTCNNLAIRSRR